MIFTDVVMSLAFYDHYIKDYHIIETELSYSVF